MNRPKIKYAAFSFLSTINVTNNKDNNYCRHRKLSFESLIPSMVMVMLLLLFIGPNLEERRFFGIIGDP